ncbi:MAG: radical SAM protein [Candidatus Omnitrophica bacterium]|nr:radical SAM protein [Candidatus Omnitrophota bacterium]
MKIKDKISCAVSVFKCLLLKKNIPLAVRWQLTNRCTLQCRYCRLWNTPAKELNVHDIIRGIDALARLGTKRISFSGGEALLRNDIEEILRYTVEKKIYPEMNTNGTLVKEKINVLKYVDFLKISLDGPEKVHDFLRGKGSYLKVIEAADACMRHGINFGFATTLTKYNIDSVDEILKLARRYNTIVAFQPLKKLYRGFENISELMMEESYFKKAVDNLLLEKASGNKNIRNSLLGLKHIYNWPRYNKLKCYAGKIFCIIDVNGDICPCDRISYNCSLPNITNMSIKNALSLLPEVYCDGCGFCGALELDYLMKLRLNVLLSIKKIIK